MLNDIQSSIHIYPYKNTWLAIDTSTSTIFELNTKMKDYILDGKENTDEIYELNWVLNQYKKEGYFNLLIPENESPEYMREIVVSVQNTLECPMNCDYCFSKKIVCETKTMDKQTALDIVEYIFNNYDENADRVEIYFTSGGEPLNNFEIIKLINEKARLLAKKNNKEFNIGFTTNAVLLNENMIQYLEHENIGFMISVDGDRDEHNSTRKFYNGNGTYEYVIKAVERLNKSDNPYLNKTQAMSVLTPYHYDYVKRLKDLVNMGFKKVNLKLVKNVDESSKKLNKLQITNIIDGYDNLLEFLKESVLDNEWKFIDAVLDQNNTLGQIMINLLLKKKILYRCGAGKNKISILPNGDIYPCDYFSINHESKIGDIYTGINKEKQEQWYARSCTSMSCCSDCWAKYLCGGSCYYTRYLNNGIPDEVECRINQYLIEKIAGIIFEIKQKNMIIYKHLVNRAKGVKKLTHGEFV